MGGIQRIRLGRDHRKFFNDVLCMHFSTIRSGGAASHLDVALLLALIHGVPGSLVGAILC